MQYQAQSYATKHLFMTFGDDFQFENAYRNFVNIDALIDYCNEQYGGEIILQYSTPSEYISAINALDREWPTKTDDMFPYADGSDAYWTGYFTSRTLAKEYIRRAQAVYAGTNQFVSLEALTQKNLADTLAASQEMAEIIGTVQHHDSVTGTEKQAVCENYNSYVYAGITKMAEVSAPLGGTEDCVVLNSTWDNCPTKKFASGATQIKILLQNPSAGRKEVVRIDVPTYSYRLSTQVRGKTVYPTADIYIFPGGSASEIYFEVDMEPLSWATYLLEKVEEADATVKPMEIVSKTYPSIELIESVSNSTPNETNIKYRAPAFSEKLDLQLRWYESWSQGGQNSGAYIFRPKVANKSSELYWNVTETVVYQGQTMKITAYNAVEGHMKVKEFTNPEIAKRGIWIITFLDSLPNKNVGTEVVLTASTNLESGKTFYTDSSGLEMQERILNYRPTWDLKTTQPISANYYPVGSSIAIRDQATKEQFTLITERAQGGSSLQSG